MNKLFDNKKDDTSDDVRDFFIAAGKFFSIVGGLIVLWLYFAFSYGFVTSKLWGWFVMSIPGFHIDYKLGLLQSIGIFMFVQFLTRNHGLPNSDSDKSPKDQFTSLAIVVLTPWMALLFAWLLKLMM